MNTETHQLQEQENKNFTEVKYSKEAHRNLFILGLLLMTTLCGIMYLHVNVLSHQSVIESSLLYTAFAYMSNFLMYTIAVILSGCMVRIVINPYIGLKRENSKVKV